MPSLSYSPVLFSPGLCSASIECSENIDLNRNSGPLKTLLCYASIVIMAAKKAIHDILFERFSEPAVILLKILLYNTEKYNPMSSVVAYTKLQ